MIFKNLLEEQNPFTRINGHYYMRYDGITIKHVGDTFILSFMWKGKPMTEDIVATHLDNAAEIRFDFGDSFPMIEVDAPINRNVFV